VIPAGGPVQRDKHRGGGMPAVAVLSRHGTSLRGQSKLGIEPWHHRCVGVHTQSIIETAGRDFKRRIWNLASRPAPSTCVQAGTSCCPQTPRLSSLPACAACTKCNTRPRRGHLPPPIT
jgi:hypothetical protein